jgi:uncharacterized membrane protein
MLGSYEALRFLHIAGGALGLVSMFVPLLTRKGSPVHRRFGKVFAIAMIVAGISGLAMSGAHLVAPEAFGSDIARIRIGGLFLGTIGLLMLGAVQQMLRSLARKRQPASKATVLDIALPIALASAGAVTAFVGVIVGAPLLIGFGALGTLTAVGDLRFVLRPLQTPKAWWYQHMQGAMIAIISAVTAFTVFGGRRWLTALVPSELGWTLWVAPSLVLVPLFSIWTARWRRRFGEHRA